MQVTNDDLQRKLETTQEELVFMGTDLESSKEDGARLRSELTDLHREVAQRDSELEALKVSHSSPTDTNSSSVASMQSEENSRLKERITILTDELKNGQADLEKVMLFLPLPPTLNPNPNPTLTPLSR